MGQGPFDTLDNAPTEDGREQEGRLLAGRYRIVRKLGEGGMGMIYLAEDIELANHKVAIKFIPPMLAGNARAVKNLQHEALTAMQLTHPNIVRLHDLHTDGHQKFLVMEYIAGKTLDDLLAERDMEKMPLEELLPIAEQVAAALDYAHSRNVLHRDLKPSNIMVTADGTVKLLDFGIAREMRDSYTRVTGQETSGTRPYMSPDQLMGEKPSPAMDVYSFGAVLYECLAGHPPFHTGDIREQIKTKSPEAIENVAPWVNETLLLALAKEPAKRPHSASELVSRLVGPPAAADLLASEQKKPCDEKAPKVSCAETPRARKPESPIHASPMQDVSEQHQPAARSESASSRPTSVPVVAPTKSHRRRWVFPAAVVAFFGAVTIVGVVGTSSRAPLEPELLPKAGLGPSSDLLEVANAQYASLDGLASGSREAQDCQRQVVAQLGLPLEVRSAKTGIVFRLIPAGTFTMGSPPDEAPRGRDETQHEVTLTKAFYCGKYEVTQGQWESVMGSNPSNFTRVGRDAPVEQVSWKDCQVFVNKLCQTESVPEGTYRLLTEAEWEYACRAGTTTPFCYGNDLDSSMANFGTSSGRKGQYRRTTVKVGTFRPNGWGLYDMHGNVWEWCQDWHGEYSCGSVTDPPGPASGDHRVHRGGSWGHDARNCWSALRYGSTPGNRFDSLGVRLARTAPSYP